jgi:hypothetical protein
MFGSLLNGYYTQNNLNEISGEFSQWIFCLFSFFSFLFFSFQFCDIAQVAIIHKYILANSKYESRKT